MAIPFLNHLDLQSISQLQNALLHKTTSTAASDVEAKIIYDTGSNTIKYYDGTQWVELGGDTDNYVDSLAFNTSSGVLTVGRTGSLSDLTVDLDGRYQLAGNYDNYQQWQITDGSQTDDVTTDQVVKFVANSSAGTAGAALTGSGTTSDPYVITYTFPNDNDDNYVDGASLSNNTLTLTRTGSLADITVDLSSLDTDDNYVDSVSIDTSTNVLTLGRTGSLSDLTADLSHLDHGSGTYQYVTKWASGGTSLMDSNIFISEATNATHDFVGINTNDSATTYGTSPEVRIASRSTDTPAVLDLLRKDGATAAGDISGILQFTIDDDANYTIAQIHTETLQAAQSGNAGGGRLVFKTSNIGSGVSPSEKMHIDNSGINFADYGSGNVTGTAAYNLSITSGGDIIETAVAQTTDTKQSIAADTSNNDRFITTVASSSGAQTGFSHSTLKYNPSTETLSVTNLVVSGTSTTVNTETISLADNIITLNSNYTGSTPSENAGIEIERGTLDNVQLNWDESDDDWEFTAYNHASTPALTTYKIPRTHKATVGGTAPWVVDHNLGTRDVIVQLYDTSSYETVYADVVRTTANRITLTFASAPAAGDVTVLVSTVNA